MLITNLVVERLRAGSHSYVFRANRKGYSQCFPVFYYQRGFQCHCIQRGSAHSFMGYCLLLYYYFQLDNPVFSGGQEDFYS